MQGSNINLLQQEQQRMCLPNKRVVVDVSSLTDLPDAFLHAWVINYRGLRYVCQSRYPNIAMFGNGGDAVLVIASWREGGGAAGLGASGAKYVYSMHTYTQGIETPSYIV